MLSRSPKLLTCLFVSCLGMAVACSTSPHAAQTAADSVRVSGVVVDSAGRPVTGALVVYRLFDTGTRLGVSDSTGTFVGSLPSAGKYQLLVIQAGVIRLATDSIEFSAGGASTPIRLQLH